jgi:hypothetical protein
METLLIFLILLILINAFGAIAISLRKRKI